MKDLVVTIPVGGPFVCPWCAATFPRRFIASDGEPSLQEHWLRNPECEANRNVSNPTQSKNHDAGLRPLMPGRETLDRVDAAARLHRVEDEDGEA